ncbi:MAG: DNA double-strand break repair nuclease NurA [Candidatus Bilamarchaeaceae archaeon]
MLEQLKSASEYIASVSEATRSSAEQMRSANPTIDGSLEDGLIRNLSKEPLGCKVCAVDGGLLFEEMYGLDLIIGRAVSVCFSYSGSRMGAAAYFPSKDPRAECGIRMGLDEHESLSFRSLFRLKLELSCAVSSLKKFDPQVLLLDGSLVPLPSDRPGEGSPLAPEYAEVLSLYRSLYADCQANGRLLLGVIKDSRGRKFVDAAARHIGSASTDSVLLNALLREGERTCVMKLGDPFKHPILKDLREHADKLNLFYMRPSALDRPIRIEFLSSPRPFDEVAGIAYSLCSINRRYAYPAVLIEADLRAMLDPDELERAKKSISIFSKNQLPSMRRNSRPFR